MELFVVHAKNIQSHKDNADKKHFHNITTDYIKTYKKESGVLQVTFRPLPNGDYFLYFDYEGAPAQVAIFGGWGNRYNALQYDHLYKKPPFDNRYGENKLTGFGYYLDSFDKDSAIFSKIHHYKELTQTYEDGSKSTLLELIEEVNMPLPNNDGAVCVPVGNPAFQLKEDGGGASFFVILSNAKLFNNTTNLENYMKYFYEALHNNSVWNCFFVLPSGTYTKLPYSIEPFTKQGYGYSLHHSSRKDMIPFLEQTRERFFEDFISNAVIQTYLYQPQDSGTFQTTYTSTWLKKDTGVTAPFMDSRCNETFILMLNDFKKSVSWLADIDPARDYANFYCTKREQKHQIYELDSKGIFFPDYFKENLLTHASLNHQLGIASMLLNSWKKYDDVRYFNVAREILTFIEHTQDKWIKENGDLYYGVKYNDNKEFEYFGNDYIYVTLLDLLLFQNAWIDFGLERNASIDCLMEAKLSYLKTTEYNIFADKPKNAPGERIDSVALALKLHKKLSSYSDENIKNCNPRIKIAEIEMTNYCNLNCSYCNTPNTSYPKGFISDETFDKALKYILPKQWIGVNAFGEPLLHKNLDKYIAKVIEKDAFPYMNTNGILLSPERLDCLISAGLRKMIVSAHAQQSIDAFRMCIDNLVQHGFVLSGFGHDEVLPKDTFVIVLRIVQVIGVNLSLAQEMVRYEFPNLVDITVAHNWGTPLEQPFSAEHIKEKMKRCKYVNTPTALMRWDGEFVVCCRDTENVVKLGNIDNYINIAQDLSKYPLICQYCMD